MNSRQLRRGVGRVLLALLVGASAATAAPNWGPATTVTSDGRRDVVRLVTAPDGSVAVRHTALPLPDDARPFASQPHVATNARGDTVALAFSDATDGPDLIFVPSGHAPQSVHLVSPLPPSLGPTFGTFFGTPPAVAIDEAGNAIVAWAPEGVTFAVTRSATGEISPQVMLSDPSSYTFARAAAVSPTGEMMVLWTEDTANHHTLRSATRSAAGAWSPATTIRTIAGRIPKVSVAFDTSGTATAVWQELPPTPSVPGFDILTEPAGDVQTATAPSGSDRWTISAAPLATGISGMSMAVSPTGYLAVATRSGVPSAGVALRTHPPGGEWGVPRSVPAARIGELRVAVSDAGDVVVGGTQFGSGDSAPSSNDDVADTPVASVAAPGQAFGPLQRLARPALGERRLTQLAIGTNGVAMAVWTRQRIFGFDPQTVRVASYAEGLQPETPPPTRIVATAAPATAEVGSLVWLRATLSQPVDTATLTVSAVPPTGRGTTVSTRQVSGQHVFVPVRVKKAGRQFYRLRLTETGSTSLSARVSVVARRPVDRLVPTTPGVGDLAVGGDTLWELDFPTGTQSGTVVARDASTGQVRSGRIRVPEAESLAASPERAWALGSSHVTPISRRTGRAGAPIPVVSPESFAQVGPIAADSGGAWVVVREFTPEQTYLARIDARLHKLTRRITLPANSRLARFDTNFTVHDGVASIAVNDIGGQQRTWRVNLATGRTTSSAGLWVGGFGTLWRLDARSTRLTPPGGVGQQVPSVEEDDPGLSFLDSLTQLSVGSADLWALQDARTVVDRKVVRRVSVTEGFSSAIPAGPPRQAVPRATATRPAIAASGDGLWISIPEYGVLAKVAASRAR
jgi:hypothetical protein